MTRMVSKLLFTALLASACTDEAGTPTLPSVITADSIDARRLRVDLSEGSYKFDASAGPIDTSLVDVVTSDGNVVPLDRVIDQQIHDRGDLGNGFTLDEVDGTPTLYILERMQWTYETSGYDSSWWRSPTANCSSTNALYGMGVALPFNFGSTGSVLFRGLIPMGDSVAPSGGKSAGQESYWGLAENWNMTAYATCGPRLAGHRVVSQTSASNTSPLRNVTVKCPDTHRLIGAGGTIVGGDGLVKVDEIRPEYGLFGLQNVTVTASKETQGSPGSWAVRAYAVCAFKPAYEPFLVTASAPPLSAVYSELIAECPAGTKLLSSAGGFSVNFPKVTRLMEVIPSVNLKYTIVRGTSRGDTTGLTGTLNAHAICVDERL